MPLRCLKEFLEACMFDVLASDAAESDLSAIRDYLLNELYNPLAVENLFSEIRRAYEALQTNPYVFEECKDAHLRSMHYRKCLVKGYLFIYRIDETNNLIHIVRFFHGSQNYVAQL